MDSMRKEHRQRAELMRKEMEEARKMHSEHFRMQIEKQAGPEFHEDLFAESKPEERNTEDRIKDEEIQQLKKQVHRQQIFRINQQWNEQLSKQRILNELYEDQLLGPYDDASVYLTGKKLIINGEKQPRKIMKKYRDMYEALSGEEIARDEIIEIQ